MTIAQQINVNAWNPCVCVVVVVLGIYAKLWIPGRITSKGLEPSPGSVLGCWARKSKEPLAILCHSLQQSPDTS